MHVLKRLPNAAAERWEGEEAQPWKQFASHHNLFADFLFAAANSFLSRLTGVDSATRAERSSLVRAPYATDVYGFGVQNPSAVTNA